MNFITAFSNNTVNDPIKTYTAFVFLSFHSVAFLGTIRFLFQGNDAMKKLLVISLISLFGLAACGVKGPLYFPAETEQSQNQ